MQYAVSSIKWIFASIITCSITLLPGCGSDHSRNGASIESTDAIDTLCVVAAIGQELGDSTNTFASIADVEIDESGRLFVLDDGNATLKAFDIQGNFIQIVSGRGPGPGELMHPRSITAMPDGRLVVCAPYKNGFVVFDDSLRFLDEIGLWPQNSPYDLSAVSNDLLAISRYDEDPGNFFIRHTIGLYSWESDTWSKLLWKDSIEVNPGAGAAEILENTKFVLFKRLETSSDWSGNIYFAPLDSHIYRVIAWDSAGVEFLNITRDIAPVEKTPAEIYSEQLFMSSTFSSLAGYSPPVEFRPDPLRNMIESVGIGPDGNLWVRRGTRLDLFFDIYDLDGNAVKQAVYPVERASWKTVITSQGVFAWELDPLEGYQRLYLISNYSD